MSKYFPKPNSLGINVKVELYLSNYATKTDLKNVTGVDTSCFAKKVHLANLKSDVDKLDNDRAQFYLILQPIYKTITTFSGLKDTVSEWESKGLSNEKFTCAYVANVSVCRKLV